MGNQALIAAGLGPVGRGPGPPQEKNHLPGAGHQKGPRVLTRIFLAERALGNAEAEHAKLSAALALFQELRMPRDQEAVEAEFAKTRSAATA